MEVRNLRNFLKKETAKKKNKTDKIGIKTGGEIIKRVPIIIPQTQTIAIRTKIGILINVLKIELFLLNVF